MTLIIIFSIYGILLCAWAMFSLIIIVQMLKYQPISFTGWIAIIMYFLIASSMLAGAWNSLAPLVDVDSISLPIRFY